MAEISELAIKDLSLERWAALDDSTNNAAQPIPVPVPIAIEQGITVLGASVLDSDLIVNKRCAVLLVVLICHPQILLDSASTKAC